MSDEQSSPADQSSPVDAGARGAAPPAPWGDIGDHWGLVLVYGLASLGLGITLAVWPGETLKVVAILIGAQFLVAGVVRIVSAMAASSLDTVLRVLLAVTGALALIVGLLCLRHPLQTLLAMGILLGAWWVASGLIDIVGAVLAPVPERRVWDMLSGVVSVLAGGFLLIDPHLTLGVLVLVTWAWLVVTGALAVLTAFRLRARRPRGSGRAVRPPEPAL